MHISLTGRLEKIVKKKVDSGLYNNASEVIREALRRMFKSEGLEALKLEQLKKTVAVGAEQAERGEFVDQSISEIASEVKEEKYG